MSRKEQCRIILANILGEAAAATVDTMSEEECIERCKEIVADFLGRNVAEKMFAGIEP
jgi:hypothetical protein